MTKTLTTLIAILALLIGAFIGYQPGHYFGKLDGATFEKSKASNAAIVETEKASKQREKIDDETRKMSDPDLIDDMRSNGWLRD